MPLKRDTHNIFLLRSALLLTTLALLSACSDTTSQPKQARQLTVAQPQLSRNDGGGNFTYDPDQDITVQLGSRNHYVVIPAGGICDIGNSSYGPKYWDAPCRPENRRTNVSYKVWTDVNGHPFVEFQPPLRFVPGKVVQLYLADSRASMDDYSEIYYCPDNKGLPCYDESVTDRSLKSVRDHRGNIYRRIKHFSGYNVAAGDENSDDARWSMSSSGLGALASNAKKSGYMVVSGAEREDQQQVDNNRRPDGDRN